MAPNQSDSTNLNDLRFQFETERSEILLIVGAGVSVATTRGAPVASWTGLLKHGLNHCRESGFADSKWAERWQAFFEDGDPDDLVLAAQAIEEKLRNNKDYARWLEQTIGALSPDDRSLIEAIKSLDVGIFTTNYDDLIERVTSYQPVTWQDSLLVEKALQNDFKAVVHLHGYYGRPDTTVLGARSYYDIVKDKEIQSLLQAAFRTRIIVFVGCGAGMDDPNIGALRNWLASVAGDSPRRHYRLVTPEENKASSLLGDRVINVEYPSHQELASFLGQFAVSKKVSTPAALERTTLEITITADKVTALTKPRGEMAAAPLGLDPVHASMVQLLESRLRDDDDIDEELEQLEARLLGRLLFDAIFVGEVDVLYKRLLTELQIDERLTIILRVSPVVKVPLMDGEGDLYLAPLPWEVLYSLGEGWLAIDNRLSLLRAIPGAQPRAVMTGERLRVLVLTVQPPSLISAAKATWPTVKWQTYENALASIEQTLKSLGGHEAVDVLDYVASPTPKNLAQAFAPRPNVVHYIGFGMQDRKSGGGRIAVLDDAGEVRWETYTQFADRCQNLRLRLVFLHLCESPSSAISGIDGDPRRANFSDLGRTLLSKGVQLVVAMQYPLLPDQGATFTSSFWESLKDPATTVGDAVQTARYRAAEFYRLGGPVLYMSDPDDTSLLGAAGQLNGGKPKTADAYTVGDHAPNRAFEPSMDQGAPLGGASPVKKEVTAIPEGQRTFAGLRLLARGVIPAVGIAQSDAEKLLQKVWQQCGGRQAPQSADTITNAIAELYAVEQDGTAAQFLEELSVRLVPGRQADIP